MAVLKKIKFGNATHDIAMAQVAIETESQKALSVVGTNTGSEDANPLYTIALAVDGKTITKAGNDGLATALALKVEAASGSGQDAKKARIALVDSNGGSGYAELSSVDIEDIVGSGVITSTSYDETTGILTITWAGGSTTAVNLGKLLDIDDIALADGSESYLSFEPVSPAAETGQAELGVKLAEVSYTPTSGSTEANLSVDTTNGSLLDAEETINAVKGYVNDVLENASAELAVKAEGDAYVAASIDANDNKKVVVATNKQDLTATAGTPGVYGTDGSQTTAPVAGTLSGTANSLADGADIAAKVKTYVDGAIAIESARSDAKNKADIAALDYTDTAAAGQVVTEVDETDGVIAPTHANLSEITLAGFTADTSAIGAIAATDTVAVALNKLQNKANAIQYKVNGTTLEFYGMGVHA